MSNGDSLGDRMKDYERVAQQDLIRRMPVIVRLDGKAFHTYTKGLDRPLDEDLHTIRQNTMEYLCNNIQGCIFGYSQSDEISLVLKDWDTYHTQPWFGNKLQKIVSVSASMCTAIFNQEALSSDCDKDYGKFENKLAMFDSRAWNLPKEEVINYLIWRQQDWERNSVQLNAQYHYSHKELQGLSCKTLITKLEAETGFIWGNEDSWKKRGEFWIKGKGIIETPLFKDYRIMLGRVLLEEKTDD